MRIETNAPALTTALLLEEVKDHLRIDGADEDASLGSLIAAATTLVENYLEMALVHRSVEFYLDSWQQSTGFQEGGDWWQGVTDGSLSNLQAKAVAVALPIKPVASIEKIEITTTAGATVLWAAENYYLTPGLSPLLACRYGRAWPVPGIGQDGIKISATAGFGPDWNSLPATIRQALLLLVTYFYYHRGDAEMGNALKASGADTLLQSYKGLKI